MLESVLTEILGQKMSRHQTPNYIQSFLKFIYWRSKTQITALSVDFLQIYLLILLNQIRYESTSTQEIQGILLAQLPSCVSNPETGEVKI